MVVGPVPIVRLQLREVGTDWVLGSMVASGDQARDVERIRRAAERMGYDVVGEVVDE